MVFGPGGCSFLGSAVLSSVDRDGGDLKPRAAGQPWYTGEREGGIRGDEPGFDRGVDDRPVGLVDEVDLEAHYVVQ